MITNGIIVSSFYITNEQGFVKFINKHNFRAGTWPSQLGTSTDITRTSGTGKLKSRGRK